MEWTNYKYKIFIYKRKEKYFVDNNVKENLTKNVKAIFLHNIGTYCVLEQIIF